MNSYKFLSEVYDSLMYDADGGEWFSYIQELLSKAGVPRHARILETGCGTGRITLPIAQAGYDVVALDASEEMLGAASEKLRQHALSARFVCGDMQDFCMPSPVTAVVCACDGVNYLTEDQDLAAFFSCCSINLAPGGALVFDISSHKKLMQNIGNNVFFDDGEVVTCLWRNQIQGNLLHMDLTFFVREGKLYRRMDEEHLQRAYKIDEITIMLHKAGFIGVEAYAFPTLEKATEENERIQFLAVKG